MRHKLGERRYRIGLVLAVAALAALAGVSWWLFSILWEMSPIIRMVGDALMAVLFAVVIQAIWILHSDPSGD